MRTPAPKESGVILCNKCEKLIAVKGITVKVLTEGEYQVRYFACPHCGWRYQITTTDEEQRALIAGRGEELTKRQRAIKNKFRPKTIKSHWERAKKLERTAEERATALKAVGEKILHPEEADNDGQNDGQGGAAGV